jgi:two-component system CheB/CheR fusion protein
MADQPPEQEPSPHSPDASKEELGERIDNIVPTHGYERLPVVGLGGSAGSIQAMRRFFEVLPEDCGLAFVVVVHLAREHESTLAELLQRVTKLTVTQVQSSNEPVEANHVYVIPPGKYLSLADGRLRLSDLPREPGRRVAVDLFFRSLADTHGAHAIAIVLSGADGDGAIGIKRIKERGGLTIAQDPSEAEQSGMPRAAIATGMVDWVLPVAQMPERVIEYTSRERRLQVPPEHGPEPLTADTPLINDEVTLREILTLLRMRTGRDFSYYKRATIVRRIARRMQVTGVDELPSYLNYLRSHVGEAGALLQDLLISVTNFFRDREAFGAMNMQIPEVLKAKSPADPVRVWVPACATGEEAYSFAILLAEHTASLETPPAPQIFATDLDEDAIMTARNGVYPEAIVADVSPERLRRFFVKEHQGYRVRREVRETVLFAAHDLLKDSPFSRLDIISCRNLLIYLTTEAQRRALDTFHFALRPYGRLFLGSSESVEDTSHLFFPVDKKHRIYAPRTAIRTNLPIPSGAGTLARIPSSQGQHTAIQGRAPIQELASPSLFHTLRTEQRVSWSELHFRLMERFGPPSLIVNAEQDIVHLSEGAGKFLQFTSGEPSNNVLRAVHPMLRIDLRAALFRANQSGEPTSALRVPLELAGTKSSVDIRVCPAGDVAADLTLIILELHPSADADLVSTREVNEPVLQHLERELEQTKRHLRDTIEQHEASTEELKASNEELQAMNEELRSATEELETSREELQSMNEELNTVNQELKNKVEELAHANSDLHNVMGATAIATVFLDRELRIMRFTPPALDLFSLIPTDIGRPLADLQHRLNYPELLPEAARVLDQLVPIEREVEESGGRSFLARLLPYRTPDDRIAGVVLTFVDITERKDARRAVRKAHEEIERRVEERTSVLDSANVELREEIAQHHTAERVRQELQSRLVSAQEEERSRISRELHDEVGQQLAVLMLGLKALESAIPPGEAASQLRALRATAEQVGREIHQLATELRPITLDTFGLTEALSRYLDTWSARTGVAVDFSGTGLDSERFSPAIETTLYRIVQEAINNIWKHARAAHVSVTIERGDRHVLALIEDNGSGFDPKSQGDSTRIGIAGMQERASLAGGQLTIESSPGRGTTVRVRIPVPPRKA